MSHAQPSTVEALAERLADIGHTTMRLVDQVEILHHEITDPLRDTVLRAALAIGTQLDALADALTDAAPPRLDG